jgi:hypothetical protein
MGAEHFSLRPMDQQERYVSKISIHGNRLTLSAELREILTTAEDDQLDSSRINSVQLGTDRQVTP